MNRCLGAFIVVAVAATLAGGCASFEHRGITDANLDQKIQQASSPADHIALADYYDEQARYAQREGRARRSARRHYEHWPPGVYYPIGTTAGIVDHYDRLIEGYEQTASESRALADWHRRMAEGQGGRPE
ncbi:MAG: hypothetical protein WC809_00025 [Sinimarinibacterium sp.]|jgi:hypothetical protein